MASVLGALSAPAGLLLSFYMLRRTEAAADPGTLVQVLASAVLTAETRQRAQLIGPGAHRIDLAFSHRVEPANNAQGAQLAGTLTDVVDYYQRLRPARLVITGEPGAGKTLLGLPPRRWTRVGLVMQPA
ncbi:hypothetical protein [Kitasatospora sp. NBC_01539]|uniref:hypothetical protein n=1 Tax=Kitasatospora sp. NBC_01539 TaxID=2903577 RepID=UPI00386022A1